MMEGIKTVWLLTQDPTLIQYLTADNEYELVVYDCGGASANAMQHQTPDLLIVDYEILPFVDYKILPLGTMDHVLIKAWKKKVPCWLIVNHGVSLQWHDITRRYAREEISIDRILAFLNRTEQHCIVIIDPGQLGAGLQSLIMSQYLGNLVTVIRYRHAAELLYTDISFVTHIVYLVDPQAELDPNWTKVREKATEKEVVTIILADPTSRYQSLATHILPQRRLDFHTLVMHLAIG